MRFTKLILVLAALASTAFAAFPTVAGRQNSSSTGTTSLTVNIDATPTDGDLMIAHCVIDGNITTTWPASPDDWTQISSNNRSAEVRLEIRYRVASSDSSSFTLGLSSSEAVLCRVWRFTTGTYTATPQVIANAVGGTSNSPDPPSRSPSWGAVDALWIVTAGNDGARNTTGFDANLTQTGSATVSFTTNGVGLGYGEREAAIASYDPTVFTISASDEWLAQTIAIQGTVGGATLKDPIGRGIIPVPRAYLGPRTLGEMARAWFWGLMA